MAKWDIPSCLQVPRLAPSKTGTSGHEGRSHFGIFFQKPSKEYPLSRKLPGRGHSFGGPGESKPGGGSAEPPTRTISTPVKCPASGQPPAPGGPRSGWSPGRGPRCAGLSAPPPAGERQQPTGVADTGKARATPPPPRPAARQWGRNMPLTIGSTAHCAKSAKSVKKKNSQCPRSVPFGRGGDKQGVR